MSKPSLERTMGDSFIQLKDTSDPTPLRRYMDEIKQLSSDGKLSLEVVRDLIDPSRDVSVIIDAVAETVLDEKMSAFYPQREPSRLADEALFWPGYSAIVVDEQGAILGVQNNPNPHPELAAYGDPLKWALLKVGQERFASIHGKSHSLLGYEAIHRGMQGGSPFDISYGMRHHLGGSREVIADAKGGLADVYAGVSGVIAHPNLQTWASTQPRLRDSVGAIIRQAQSERGEILDDFDGNLFAGSLDSSLAEEILDDVTGKKREWVVLYGHRNPPSFARKALEQVIHRHSVGMNVH